ncbi:MAG: hypothetical protein OXC30_05565 [Alphaproteobacteria bacterium]|nr:hypothetical protein [Alphaproteobacteria bacterium]
MSNIFYLCNLRIFLLLFIFVLRGVTTEEMVLDQGPSPLGNATVPSTEETKVDRPVRFSSLVPLENAQKEPKSKGFKSLAILKDALQRSKRKELEHLLDELAFHATETKSLPTTSSALAKYKNLCVSSS